MARLCLSRESEVVWEISPFLNPAEVRALVKRGAIQIAALLAAKITGRGLIINDGDTEYSWDFILVDASSDEQNTFDERLLRMLSDYIHAGFPDAVIRHIQHEAPKLSK